MLTDIKIENFALLQDMEIHFHPGFNVLTGESGSGKSLIIEALNFVLGERVPSGKISGEKSVVVQARFELKEDFTGEAEKLCESGIIDRESGELILTRKMYPSGRNTYLANGEMLPYKLYRALGETLVDIHGQRDSQFLLNPKNQLKMLDLLGGDETHRLLGEIKSLYHHYREIHREMNELKARERDRNREIDWVEYEIKEIEEARLQPGEYDRLEREKSILENAEKISEVSTSIYNNLSAEEGALDRLNAVSRSLTDWIRYDPQMEPLLVNLNGAMEQIQELSFLCREKGEETAFSQEDLDDINGRLHKIDRLKSKYGADIVTILEYLGQSRKKLEELRAGSSRVEALEKELEDMEREWNKKSLVLSGLRKNTAVNLRDQLLGELSSLGMDKACFEVSFISFNGKEGESGEGKENDFPVTPYGMDRVEFCMGPNPGQPMKPMHLIASGGELSRIMLSLRSVFSRQNRFPTLVLDEIDMGLGGVSAGSVGKKIQSLSENRQILCITHLPVIAALADSHFQIEKVSVEETTRTVAAPVMGRKREEEVMRMLAGEETSGETRRLARKLLRDKNDD